jgi:tetratricopeptide (TPR) repeat protein
MLADRRIRLRRLIVVNLYLLAADWGICRGSQLDHRVLGLLFPVAVASMMSAWCVVDAQVLGRPIITAFHWLLFVAWPLAVPVYLVRSRKFRGVAVAFIHGLGLGASYVVLLSLPLCTAYWLAYEGRAALVDMDYDRAIGLLGRAVRMRSDDAISWYNLGAALQGRGRMGDAVAAYERAMTLDRGFAECRSALFEGKWQLAYEAQTRGDPNEAKARYREALTIDGSQPAIWYNFGLACDASGDVAAAIEALKKACSLDPRNADYRRGLEALRRKAGRSSDPKF